MHCCDPDKPHQSKTAEKMVYFMAGDQAQVSIKYLTITAIFPDWFKMSFEFPSLLLAGSKCMFFLVIKVMCQVDNKSLPSENWPFLSEQSGPVQSPWLAAPQVSWHKTQTYLVCSLSCSVFLNALCAHCQSDMSSLVQLLLWMIRCFVVTLVALILYYWLGFHRLLQR